MSRLARLALLVSGLAFAPSFVTAETVHLTVRADGALIEGESTQFSLGRQGTIECFAFATELSLEASTGRGIAIEGGRFTCRKRLDKASPALAQALVLQQPVTMIARFFRPNPAGDGTTEQYYTITATQGRVVSVAIARPDTTQGATVQLPDLEDVALEFGAVVFRYENGGREAAWESAERHREPAAVAPAPVPSTRSSRFSPRG